MSAWFPTTSRRLRAWCVATPALAVTGCMSGSMATSTGPAGPSGWSVEKRQDAHVGERVTFQFIVVDAARGAPVANMAEYAVWDIGGVPDVTAADADGRFRTSYVFEAPSDADIAVRATAYRRRGSQDTQAINGKLVRLGNPNDLPDARVASGGVTLRVYQAEVRFEVPAQSPDLLWSTALVTFQAGDGVQTLRPERPGRPGFSTLIDEAAGTTIVTCTPSANFLQTTGTTDVRLLVHDEVGEQHVFATTLSTP